MSHIRGFSNYSAEQNCQIFAKLFIFRKFVISICQSEACVLKTVHKSFIYVKKEMWNKSEILPKNKGLTAD
ncbi:MAG: hypothetical protein A2Y10_13215 [Planctomycetes bacterium GWF2_41_51]|nr:MAG: hypothetical protein A2Y10_13215 [Planctomycetes bacterium GWF2_41_51]